MAKPTIAIDMDDVLVDSTEYWRQEINRRTGANLTREHWSVPGEYHNYYETVWQTHGIADKFSIADIDAQMELDQSVLPAVPYAVEALRHLSERFELVVVTARIDSRQRQSKQWLDEVYPGIFGSIVFGNGAEGLAKKNKGQICKEVGAAWLIDDNPGHCKDVLQEGVQAILFGTYGWHTEIPKLAVHCRDWQAVEAYFATQ